MASYETQPTQSSVTKGENVLQQSQIIADGRCKGDVSSRCRQTIDCVDDSKASHLGKEAKAETEAEANVTEEAAKKKRKNCFIKMVQGIQS